MPKAILVVHTEPASPEDEAAYNEWYDGVHVPDIVALPGFTGATRYRVSATQMGGATPDVPRYVAVYEIDADDLDATLKGIGAGVASGAVRMGDAPMGPKSSMVLYEEVTPA
ncbi:MAG: hypothetical protein AB7H43_09175 [Acidimicrobiia bacterium]